MRPFLIAAALLLAAAPPAFAKPARPAAAPSTDEAIVRRASAYLSGLKSAQAKFTQTDPRGAVTTGTFSLQRPGRARFAYDPPADLTVVADGANVNVQDAKLKTFDTYPLKQTPLAILLSERVKLTEGVAVGAVNRSAGAVSITVRDARNPAQGSLTLDFNVSPMALTGWTVVDATGQQTTVKLSGLRTGVALSPSLFVLHDPRPQMFRP